jgi:hypothetical protein
MSSDFFLLSVVYAECHISALYAECHISALYAECQCAECRYADCRGASTTTEHHSLLFLNVEFLRIGQVTAFLLFLKEIVCLHYGKKRSKVVFFKSKENIFVH